MKKIITAALTAVMALSSIGTLSASAYYTPTSWSSNNEYWGKKSSSSGVYILNSSSNRANISLYGENTSGGLGYYSVSTYGSSYHNTSGVIIPASSCRRVYQFVNELGYSYVHLCVGNMYGSASGSWSPDTTETCTYAN